MKYFAIIDGEQKGPFDLDELASVGVRPSTYVWCKGMKDWEKAEDVADICRLYRNRLYDLMHPADPEPAADMTGIKNLPSPHADSGVPPAFPTRFDRYLSENDAHIPSLEEIDERQNKDIPPANVFPLAIIATIFFFPPTGAVALYFAYKTKKSWKDGEHEAAHENCRSAKMWTGITFCLGLIFYALMARL